MNRALHILPVRSYGIPVLRSKTLLALGAIFTKVSDRVIIFFAMFTMAELQGSRVHIVGSFGCLVSCTVG